MQPKIRFRRARVELTGYEVKTENRAVFVACRDIVGVLHTPANEILTKNWRMGWYMRRAAVKKIPPPADHWGLRGHRSGPARRRLVAMIDTLAYIRKLENGHIWAFLPRHDCAILHAILHWEPTQEQEKGAAPRPEALGGYYFTQSTILHKVFASRGIRTRPPRAAPARAGHRAGHIEQQHNIA